MFDMETFKKFNKELPLHVEIDEDGRVNIINKNNEKILSGSNNPCYYETEYNYATSIVEIINTFEKDFENVKVGMELTAELSSGEQIAGVIKELKKKIKPELQAEYRNIKNMSNN
jgi:hypothetical protein